MSSAEQAGKTQAGKTKRGNASKFKPYPVSFPTPYDIELVGRMVYDMAKTGKSEECAFAHYEMSFDEIRKIKQDARYKAWREKAKVAFTGYLTGEILEAMRSQAKSPKSPEMIARMSDLINLVKKDGTAHENFQKVSEMKTDEHLNSFNIQITIPEEEQRVETANETSGQ